LKKKNQHLLFCTAPVNQYGMLQPDFYKTLHLRFICCGSINRDIHNLSIRFENCVAITLYGLHFKH
jgi:hypothetical protein